MRSAYRKMMAQRDAATRLDPKMLARARERNREQREMSPAEAETLMRTVIRAALDARGTVERQDFVRAYLPSRMIDQHANRLLTEELAAHQAGGDHGR